MGSAVLNPSPHPPVPSDPTTAPESAEALRQQAAARIAALRQRRSQTAPRPAGSAQSATPQSDPGNAKSRIAAAVAERYAQAQTYRAFLAAEAERAVQQARAAAEIAARNAKAIADAQQQLLGSLAAEAKAHSDAEPKASATLLESAPTLWPDLAPEPESTTRLANRPEPKNRVPRPGSPRAGSEVGAPHNTSTLEDDCHPERSEEPAFFPAVQSISSSTVRIAFYEDISPLAVAPITTHPAPGPDPYDPEAWLLDEEISFRHSPVFEEPAGPPTALPANLIEFPRQLVASRKARPRYAEGPLRDEPADHTSQLRIFEVDPAQIATTPDPTPSAEAQWTSLWLDAPGLTPAPDPPTLPHCDPERSEGPAFSSHCYPDPERAEGKGPAFSTAKEALPVAAADPQLYPARWSRRALAASIDLGITAAATLSFAVAFAAITGHTATAAWDTHNLLTGAAASLHGLPLPTSVGALTATGIALSLAYQALFFTFSESTPGMRLARIGLCTFSDDNPTRTALRRRVPALALSTLLFGIGLLWALLDEDGLPWHDLISRIYPRSY